MSTQCLAHSCENFLYGFKGAPPARQTRAEPAQESKMKPRSAGGECVGDCEHDH
jgi:hypothetical protein